MTPDERALLVMLAQIAARVLERRYIETGGKNERDLDESEKIDRLVRLVVATRTATPEGT